MRNDDKRNSISRDQRLPPLRKEYRATREWLITGSLKTPPKGFSKGEGYIMGPVGR